MLQSFFCRNPFAWSDLKHLLDEIFHNCLLSLPELLPIDDLFSYLRFFSEKVFEISLPAQQLQKYHSAPPNILLFYLLLIVSLRSRKD